MMSRSIDESFKFLMIETNFCMKKFEMKSALAFPMRLTSSGFHVCFSSLERISFYYEAGFSVKNFSLIFLLSVNSQIWG